MVRKYSVNKKKYSKILICTLMGSIISAGAKANHSIYFGVDALYSKMTFKEDFGGNIISKKLMPGLNLFTGYMFNEYFGTEIGFETYKKMKRTENNISHGTMVAGVQLDGNTPTYWESYRTTICQRHPYFGLLAKLNIANNNYISLLAGVSLSQEKSQYTIFNNDGGEIATKGEIVRTFSKTKVIPMLRATIEHKCNNKLGIRALVGWKQTSLFKMKSQENNISNACIKAKDSFNFGVGAIYYIG